MGFGILFIGYIIAYLLSMAGSYGCYFALIGYVIMMYSLTKTAEYEKRFKYAFLAVLPLIVCTAFLVFLELSGALNFNKLPAILLSPILRTVVEVLKAVFDMLYHAALLLAISKIAKDTGVENISRSALRNLLIYSVFFVTIIVQFSIPDVEANATLRWYIFILAMLLWLICFVLDCITIFSCYMRICDEGDVEVTRKESRFGFVNKLRREFDRREEKAIESNREYHTYKMKKRIDRINSGKKKKK